MNDANKTWWSATATFKATHPERPRRRNLWERTTFLVWAAGHEEAEAAALALARDKQHEYQGATGELVRWVLGELKEVKELADQELRPGAEVQWEFFERVDNLPADKPERERACCGITTDGRPL